MKSIRIQVDTEVHAAYIQLSDGKVHRSVDFNDQILVDLDEFGVAVGIEILDEAASLPFVELVRDFHVHSDVVSLLRLIRPDVASFMSFHQGTEGTSTARSAQALQPA